MPILTVIIILIIIGIALWLINNYIPMDSKIKTIINIIIVIGVIIWLLQTFGIIGSLKHLKIF